MELASESPVLWAFYVRIVVMNKLYQKTKAWVEKIYFNADHLIRTAYWIRELTPKPSEALLIAALTHDIERVFKEGRKPSVSKMRKWDDQKENQWHSERSAKFVKDFLKKENTKTDLIEEVLRLINHHEEGGWDEADLLRDADSLSFLEINVPFFISRIPKELSKKEVKEKFNYMFMRIGSKKAREIAKPFYKKAMFDLNKVEG